MPSAPVSQRFNPLAAEFIGYHPDRTPFTSTPYNQVPPAPPVQQADSTTAVLEQLVTLLSKCDRLPQIEPEIFSGDILAFPAWLRSFESQIEAHTTTDEERLFYLGKYTTGEAKKVINGFLTLDGPGIFSRAQATLKQRYGDRYHIAAAFKRELSN